MEHLEALVLISVIILLHSTKCASNSGENLLNSQLQSNSKGSPEYASISCPDTWFVPHNRSCRCGKTFNNRISCDSDTKEVGVIDCYCMTYDPSLKTAVFGACPFNCINVTKLYSDYMYHPVPRNIASGDDNNSVCGYLYRTGVLCSQCIKGYYPAAYSYLFECISSDMKQSTYWMIYLVEAYLPLTLFMALIFMVRISVISPRLYISIIMMQNIAIPINLRVMVIAARHYYIVNIMTQIVISFYSIWNFDFFRTLLPPVCLHISPLYVLALDYLIAIYPMAVLVCMFTLLKLHEHGCKPVLYIWKPFHAIFARFRREWNLHTSLIEAFITYFLLSTTKLIHTSAMFLLPTVLYTADDKIEKIQWYTDSSVKYFGSSHLPLAVLALTIGFLFIILPVCLLLSYHFKCCQRCLKLKCRVLNEVIHTFNKYYKDGSEGSLDCRWFAAYYLITRLGLYIIVVFTMTGILYNILFVYSIICVIPVIIMEPYKEEYKNYNILDPVIMLIQSLWLSGITGVNIANLVDRVGVKPLFVYVGMVSLLPVAYFCILTVRWLHQRRLLGLRPSGSRNGTPDELPDRLINSETYATRSW